MLRDMEELLNSVKDNEIKEHMKEALACYNCKSYKGCIILSMTAAMYDLHNKIKTLAGAVKDIRELDSEIETKKANRHVYERHMIDKCSTDKIGVLTTSEGKMLNLYMDFRNQCAHPGGHKSSAEEARMVFSGVIDILLSKPHWLGANHKNIFLEQLKESTFFPYQQEEYIKKIVLKKIEILHKNARTPIVKSIVKVLKDKNNTSFEVDAKQLENIKMFLAYVGEVSDLDISDIIQPLISDDFCTADLIDIVSINAGILKKLNPIDIDKIIVKIRKSIEEDDEFILKNDGKYLVNLMYRCLENLRYCGSFDIKKLLDCIDKIKTIRGMYDVIDNFKCILEPIEEEYLIEIIYNRLKGMDELEFKSISTADIENIIKLFKESDSIETVLLEKINNLLETGDFYFQKNAISKLNTINKHIREESLLDLKILIVKSIVNASYNGEYSCEDIVKGYITDLENIFNVVFEKIIIDSNKLNLLLDNSNNHTELFKLLLNTKGKEFITEIIECINMGNLYISKDEYIKMYSVDRKIKKINNALDDLNIGLSIEI